ncbi:hypothetical protein CHS0354_023024 [Potamilus streckersoni]|uniref:TLDc domain-containing protein n=1 Tax=Potamilus streckersoni TaxID=2493646 RepID=A0AAE0RWG3_9BIVA|nr:hypothetical protein CHS0354_023024 [Potamilus streckersoni]
MAQKLTKKEKKQLETWIRQGPKTFQLLYSIQRDGCSAITFHQRCDNQGSTVTVVYNTSNSVYGGFTTKTWASTNNYVTDDRAFLFQLRMNGIEKFNLFPVTLAYVINAIYPHSNYGPTFGGGHTLHTFTGTVSSSGSGFFLNGYTKFQAGYYSCSLSDSDITNGHLNVFDIEVYKVIDEPDPIERPWRMAPPLKKEHLQQLMEKIENYCPPSVLPVSYAKILMIGPVGAGKSSFFNTINSVFKGRITYQASSGSAEHSLTTVYMQYPVRSVKTGLELKFRLCDMCGLEESFGPDVVDLHFLISGNIPERYQFNPSSPVSADIPGFIYQPELKDKIHCVVFVLDGNTVDDFPQSILSKLNHVQRRMNLINLPRVVLLTKIDKLSTTVQPDVSKVFESGKVKEAVDKASEIMGVPRSNVIPIKNYENEVRLDDSTSCLALLALDQIIGFADDFLTNQRIVVQS